MDGGTDGAWCRLRGDYLGIKSCIYRQRCIMLEPLTPGRCPYHCNPVFSGEGSNFRDLPAGRYGLVQAARVTQSLGQSLSQSLSQSTRQHSHTLRSVPLYRHGPT